MAVLENETRSRQAAVLVLMLLRLHAHPHGTKPIHPDMRKCELNIILQLQNKLHSKKNCELKPTLKQQSRNGIEVVICSKATNGRQRERSKVKTGREVAASLAQLPYKIAERGPKEDEH
jgi:hypothetical protein